MTRRSSAYAASSHHAPPDLPPPSALLMALEVRAFWEMGALAPSWPILRKAPRGDGHGVVVFPGLAASDASTAPLRTYLDSLGYRAHGWTQGFNFGARAGVLETAKRQVLDVAEHTGRKVSLIGWSLGGVYARELAKLLPDVVRCVQTLGTPFSGPAKSTNAWRVYEMASGRNVEHETTRYDLAIAPPVPTTSVYSKTDGVVAWQGSLQAPSKHNPHTENVEVLASHLGIGVNPAAWWVVADRLSQTEGAWKPFERKPGLHGLVFPKPPL